jgi:hypothetical protein
LLTQITSGEGYTNYEAPHYVILSSILIFPGQNVLTNTVLKHSLYVLPSEQGSGFQTHMKHVKL